jgi:hypothetical protein
MRRLARRTEDLLRILVRHLMAHRRHDFLPWILRDVCGRDPQQAPRAVPGPEFLGILVGQSDRDGAQVTSAVLVVVEAPPLLDREEPLEFAPFVHPHRMLASPM